MIIDLTKRQEGEIWQEENDDRFFKCCIFQPNGIFYYLYGFKKHIDEDTSKITFMIDWHEAQKLAKARDVRIEYMKITHVIDDHVLFSAKMRSFYNDNLNLFIKSGKRYIAEAKAIYKPIENSPECTIVRSGSACIDNVTYYFRTHAPEIAVKRAAIKCIIDALDLNDVVAEYEIVLNDDEDNKAKKKTKKTAKKKIEDGQFKMLKKLLGKKFDAKKYTDMTYEQATKEIEKYNPHSTKTTKKKVKKK